MNRWQVTILIVTIVTAAMLVAAVQTFVINSTAVMISTSIGVMAVTTMAAMMAVLEVVATVQKN